MGSSCSKSDKVDEGKTRRLQQQRARAEVVARSEPIELRWGSSVKFKLQACKAHTALEVLDMVAQQMQFPGKAGALLKMQFAEAIIPHHNTMHEAGLCDQAEFVVLGEDEARALLMEAEAVDIHEAANRGDVKVLRLLLLLAPANANAQNGIGYTPLHIAAENNQCEVAEVLLAAGADVNAKSNVTAYSAHLLLLSVLLGGQGGCTPLQYAALNNQCEVAEVLLAAGADVNAKSNVTARSAHLLLLSVLLGGQGGFTPLHWAAYEYKFHCEVAELLLAAGADVNAKNKVTARCAYLLLLSVLLDGQRGKTPLQEAKDDAMKYLLRKAGAK